MKIFLFMPFLGSNSSFSCHSKKKKKKVLFRILRAHSVSSQKLLTNVSTEPLSRGAFQELWAKLRILYASTFTVYFEGKCKQY